MRRTSRTRSACRRYGLTYRRATTPARRSEVGRDRIPGDVLRRPPRARSSVSASREGSTPSATRSATPRASRLASARRSDPRLARGRARWRWRSARRRRSLRRAPEPGRSRGRGRLPDVQDDARPVELADRDADEGVHPRAASRRATSAAQIKAELVDQFGAERARRAAQAWVRPPRLAAAARRPRDRSRLRRRSRLDLEPAARRGRARRPSLLSTQRSSGGSTRSSPGSRSDEVRPTEPLVALLAGFVSFLAPCVCLSCPAICRPCRRSRRIGSVIVARPVASCSRASRSCSASPPCSSLLGVGAQLLGAGIFRDQFLLERVAGFVLVVFGFAFMGLLPWPERLVGAGLCRAPAVVARGCCSAVRSRSARPRASGPCWRRSSSLAGTSDTAAPGRVPARLLFARGWRSHSSSPERSSRARWARSAGCATTTSRSSSSAERSWSRSGCCCSSSASTSCGST